VTVTLDHGPTAPLGGTMAFTLTATSVWDAPNPNASDGNAFSNAEISVALTEGLDLLDSGWSAHVVRPGVTDYRKPVVFKAGKPSSFDVTITLAQPGTQFVTAGVSITRVQGSIDSTVDTLYLNIGSAVTHVQRDPFPEQRIPPTASPS
jgi:hypothetical protein